MRSQWFEVMVEGVPAVPVTPSDGFFLGLESYMRRAGQGRHLAVTVLELAGVPDVGLLREQASRMASRYPILGARIRRGWDFLARWEPAVKTEVPLREHGEVVDVRGWMQRVLAESVIDIFQYGPNLELHVARLGADRWGMLVVWSHVLLDAVGIEKFLVELSGESVGHDEAGGVEEKRSMGELWKLAQPITQEMRTFPKQGMKSPYRPEARAGKAKFRVVTFDREQTRLIRGRMKEKAGELLLLPYFACVAGRSVLAVLKARNPAEVHPPLLLSLPVQKQPNPARRPLFQNRMTPYNLLIPGADFADVREGAKAIYRKYADFMRRKLPAAMDALMELMERIPSKFYLLPARAQLNGEISSLFHSHTGQFALGREQLFGVELLNGYHVPTVSGPPGLGIFFSECREQLTLSLSWREGVFAPGELELLCGQLFEDLGVAQSHESH